MAIIKEDGQIFFGGLSITLIKGNFIDDNSPIVKAKPELFEVSKPEVKSVKPVAKTTKRKVKKEEPKEQLLVEEPVQALKVEEKTEEPKEELSIKTTKTRAKK